MKAEKQFGKGGELICSVDVELVLFPATFMVSRGLIGDPQNEQDVDITVFYRVVPRCNPSAFLLQHREEEAFIHSLKAHSQPSVRLFAKSLNSEVGLLGFRPGSSLPSGYLGQMDLHLCLSVPGYEVGLCETFRTLLEA